MSDEIKSIEDIKSALKRKYLEAIEDIKTALPPSLSIYNDVQLTLLRMTDTELAHTMRATLLYFNGGELPENLTIIFSHWLNSDGTYYPMDNRHNLPTSEFIPFGMEKLAEKVTHICPCSDPTVKATCATCDHACYSLKKGESMALLEHSTKATKARDKAIKEAKKALK